MGPDCGTAIINGVPLAFANEVKQGKIGIVAAAGTGLQEVSTLISNSAKESARVSAPAAGMLRPQLAELL
jgi:succinyl-CoA synthetase alpha subunit